MAQEIGQPFTLIPTEMYAHFAGGVALWGTICGSIAVAASAIGLVSDPETQRELTRELFGWYNREAHPAWTPTGKEEQPQIAVNSTLCHVSVTKWMNYAGEVFGKRLEFSGPERGERCARLTASVSKKTIQLLNDKLDEKLQSANIPTEDVGACMACHGDDGRAPTAHGSDSCIECHSGTDISDNHGGLDINELKEKIYNNSQ